MKTIRVPFIEKEFTPDADASKGTWTQIEPQVTFSTDWRDEEMHSAYSTEVRLCWSQEYLYVLWTASYAELHTVAEPEEIGRGESWGLWEGDVVEFFIGDSPDQNRYFEFVASPLGQWIDLRHNKNLTAELSYDAAWESGWTRAVRIDRQRKQWVSEWRIPLGAITTQRIEEGLAFRGNFYRISKQSAEELYLAWSPTMSLGRAAFHVPERFGTIVLQGRPEEKKENKL